MCSHWSFCFFLESIDYNKMSKLIVCFFSWTVYFKLIFNAEKELYQTSQINELYTYLKIVQIIWCLLIRRRTAHFKIFFSSEQLVLSEVIAISFLCYVSTQYCKNILFSKWLLSKNACQCILMWLFDKKFIRRYILS